MNQFFHILNEIMAKAQQTQVEALQFAGKLVAECVMHNGLVHIFGTGHSHILAEELFNRSGGLIPISPILEPGLMVHVSAITSTQLERLEGYAAIILSRYVFSSNDVMIIASNSGRNAVPVEAAILTRQRGIPVIALTSLTQSMAQPSRHSSGKRLFEVADVVLDNFGRPGDAAVEIDNLPFPVCPTSTIIGAALLQDVIYEAVLIMNQNGFNPPILRSTNLVTDQDLWKIYSGYRDRIRHL